MSAKEQIRREPTLADLEAFERLLRESLAKDQTSIAGKVAEGATPPVGLAANDLAPVPRPVSAAPGASDPLAELTRMIETPLDFGLPPLPVLQPKPAAEPAPVAEPLPMAAAPFEPADFHRRNAAGGPAAPTRFPPIDLDVLLGRQEAATAIPAEASPPQLAQQPADATPEALPVQLPPPARQDRGPIVLPFPARGKEVEIDPLAAFEEELRRFDLRLNDPLPAPPQALATPPLPVAEAGWSAPAWQEAPAPAAAAEGSPAPGTFDEPPTQAMAQSLEQNEERLAAEAAAAAAATGAEAGSARRSKGVFFALGGIAIAGLAAIGATFAFGDRPAPAAGGQVPVIAAKAEPAKEKPANPGGVEIPNQNKQVLATKDARPETGQAQVVNTAEQPLDLREVTRREPVRVIAPSPFQSQPPTPAAPAAAQATEAPPTTASTAPPTVEPPPPEARRVQSVRIGDPIMPQPASSAIPPAGTPAIASGSAAIAAIAAGATAARPSPPAAAQPSQPVPSAPSRPAAATPATPPATVAALPPAIPVAPKVESRPESVPTTPAAPRINPPAARPRDATSREPALRSANAPLDLTTPRPARPTPAGRPAVAGGGFSVQLASRPSQAEAETASGQLRSRFSGQLGGRGTSVVSGTANGQTVYRVRAGGYSQADATAACNRIKTAGGSCFVTR